MNEPIARLIVLADAAFPARLQDDLFHLRGCEPDHAKVDQGID